MFSPDGTLISASAAPHCGGQRETEPEPDRQTDRHTDTDSSDRKTEIEGQTERDRDGDRVRERKTDRNNKKENRSTGNCGRVTRGETGVPLPQTNETAEALYLFALCLFTGILPRAIIPTDVRGNWEGGGEEFALGLP